MGYQDVHSHILPEMDDGAKSAGMSADMLDMLSAQGVSTVVATSHFIPHKESVSSYIKRRTISFEKLSAACAGKPTPKVLLGAEIYLEKGISDRDLRPLCIGQTNMLLLELPRIPFQDWMIYEIESIMYSFSVVPVMAHLERYLSWYRKSEIAAVLSIEDVICQLSVSSFSEARLIKFGKQLDGSDIPLLFGSDAHNLTNRAPNWSMMTDKLNQKPKLRHLWDNAQRTALKFGLE